IKLFPRVYRNIKFYFNVNYTGQKKNTGKLIFHTSFLCRLICTWKKYRTEL
ncbi:hypothetical protein L9F63_024587, partial [Diploptera punctata]